MDLAPFLGFWAPETSSACDQGWSDSESVLSVACMDVSAEHTGKDPNLQDAPLVPASLKGYKKKQLP